MGVSSSDGGGASGVQADARKRVAVTVAMSLDMVMRRVYNIFSTLGKRKRLFRVCALSLHQGTSTKSRQV